MELSDFNLDEAFLVDVGLDSLPDPDKPAMLAHIKEQLVMQVGEALVKRLKPAALAQFSHLSKQNDSLQILAFLKQHIPDYQVILRAEIKSFKQRLRAEAPQLLEKIQASETQPGDSPV